MTSKLLSRRDVEFLPYEWLDVTALCARPRHADHSRETFDAALATLPSPDASGRERVVWWWAQAIDHQARAATPAVQAGRALAQSPGRSPDRIRWGL